MPGMDVGGIVKTGPLPPAIRETGAEGFPINGDQQVLDNNATRDGTQMHYDAPAGNEDHLMQDHADVNDADMGVAAGDIVPLSMPPCLRLCQVGPHAVARSQHLLRHACNNLKALQSCRCQMVMGALQPRNRLAKNGRRSIESSVKLRRDGSSLVLPQRWLQVLLQGADAAHLCGLVGEGHAAQLQSWMQMAHHCIVVKARVKRRVE